MSDTVILKKLFLKASSSLTSLGYLITLWLHFPVLIGLVPALLCAAYKYKNEPNQAETIRVNYNQYQHLECYLWQQWIFIRSQSMSHSVKQTQKGTQELCPHGFRCFLGRFKTHSLNPLCRVSVCPIFVASYCIQLLETNVKCLGVL